MVRRERLDIDHELIEEISIRVNAWPDTALVDGFFYIDVGGDHNGQDNSLKIPREQGRLSIGLKVTQKKQ